jgi:restriction system protein
VVEPYGATAEGQLVRAIEIPWRAIVQRLKADWTEAFRLESRLWEELIAAAFDAEGYEEVTLTPRSGDYGRDVIAVKKGVGCVRIIDSVKAYRPGHLVRHDDVRALAGVLAGDQKASKGILTMTSDFAPSISADPFLAPLMPYRLELMNGQKLQEWLSRLHK